MARHQFIIAETVEVDSKLFKPILPLEVKCYMTCMYKKRHCIPYLLLMLKIVRVINFRWFHYPRRFFNNEIFPNYGNHKSCVIILLMAV